jgi:amidase
MGGPDPFTTATELAAAVRTREVSPVELAELYLQRIDRFDPRLNAFCHRADDDVLAAAKVAERRVVDGPVDELPPFLGVPLPIKDLNHVAGWPTTHGSRATSRSPNAVSEFLVERLVRAGFVLLGMTNAPELGTISYTESQAHGVTRNPWDLGRTPGGSSGGAAAAVASGLAPIAQASDGGGSIRIPASCCGLVGLKPSRNRVPNGLNRDEGYGTDGVVSRSVADTAAVLDVIARPDPLAWYNAPPSPEPWSRVAALPPPRLRVHVMTDPPVPLPVDEACLVAVQRTAEALVELGHEIVDADVELPDAGEFVEAFTVVWDAGSAGTPLVDEALLEPLNAALRAKAKARSSIDYVESVLKTQCLSRTVVANWGEAFDVLLTPTMAVEPPHCGTVWVGADADPELALTNCFPMAVFTSLFNVTGQPALSLPVHLTDGGLPVGVQLVAGPWQDALLLQLGTQLEPVFDWAARRPPLVG